MKVKLADSGGGLLTVIVCCDVVDCGGTLLSMMVSVAVYGPADE